MGTTPLHTHHGMRWAPETKLGRWALSLMGLALGGTVVLAIAFSAGLETAESFTDNWLLSAAGVAILASVAASAATVVPEIDAFSGLAAMGLVGSIAALIWERRRKK